MKHKIYRIETRSGWFCLPERIGSFNFPMSCAASFQAATVFFGRLSAIKTIKRFKLTNAHIEEFEEGEQNFPAVGIFLLGVLSTTSKRGSVETLWIVMCVVNLCTSPQ